MDKETISRINALAQKSQTPAGLNAAEREEQAALRQEYIAAMKQSLKAQLDNTVVVDEQGNSRKLKQTGGR